MITVEEALKIVQEKTIPNIRVKKLSLKNAFGFVLAKNVISPIDMPPFPQSAMDGYAVNCLNKNDAFTIVGEIEAGKNIEKFYLNANEAIRIFTGAEVPESANMVIKQEDAISNSSNLHFSVFPKQMANIRIQGEQIRKGETALPKGHELNERSIGFLASIGVNQVMVYDHPKIAIISTGNELIPLGRKLKRGEIYESNSLMIQTALRSKGYPKAIIIKIKDNYLETVRIIDNCLKKYDVLICSGGISVGDYDFIGKAFQKNNVLTHFYKVKQKPGKPLYFGQKEKVYTFGLPGNPAACLTGFYIYILPFLNKWKGGDFLGLTTIKANLKHDYTLKGDRAEFLKGKVVDGEVEVLQGQSSAMLKSYSSANAIIYIPIEKLVIKAGETVNYYMI